MTDQQREDAEDADAEFGWFVAAVSMCFAAGLALSALWPLGFAS